MLQFVGLQSRTGLSDLTTIYISTISQSNNKSVCGICSIYIVGSEYNENLVHISESEAKIDFHSVAIYQTSFISSGTVLCTRE